MGKVLQADADAAPAQVFADLGADEPDIWITFDLAFSAATLALPNWQFGTGGSFCDPNVDDGFGAPGGAAVNTYIKLGEWSNGYMSGPPPVVTADTWHTLQLHYMSDPGTWELIVDGTSVFTMAAPGGQPAVRWVGFGLDSGGDPDDIVYIDNIKIGTTAGGSDLFADDFEDGTLAAFPVTTGDVSVIDDPYPPDELAGRVLIAFDDVALEPVPTWTRIDDTPNLVAGIEIRRGRQTEFDITQTSTATVHVNDTAGLFDPDNVSSPYYGKLDGKQILLQVQNPVTAEWVTQFRGHINDYRYNFHPATVGGVSILANVVIECVDFFDYLANVEMQPGTFGDPPPSDSLGTVWYPDQSVQERLQFILTDAGVSSTLYSIFTGNVDVQETKYDPGDSMLIAMRDAADAEFPGVANLYCDKIGRIVFHGRFARFDPDSVSFDTTWDFQRWKAGDGAAITLDPTRAQIRPPLQWSRPRSMILNAGISYPRGIEEPDIPGQLVEDAGSIAAFGRRSWSATDLIVAGGTTTGFDANQECALFADYYVQNYKEPTTRLEALSFQALDPDDPRAVATWALMCGCDISDIVNLSHGYPGGVGLVSEDLYIDGLEMQIRPLQGDAMDYVELSLNVTPSSLYSEDVFS